MTKAETIFWTFFKGSEEDKANWCATHQAQLLLALAEGHDAQNTDSELRVVDASDNASLRVMADMPSHVWVKPDGQAVVRWFDTAAGQFARQDLNNPVRVGYNRFGKVTHKTWLNADGTLTEREFNG